MIDYKLLILSVWTPNHWFFWRWSNFCLIFPDFWVFPDNFCMHLIVLEFSFLLPPVLWRYSGEWFEVISLDSNILWIFEHTLFLVLWVYLEKFFLILSSHLTLFIFWLEWTTVLLLCLTVVICIFLCLQKNLLLSFSVLVQAIFVNFEWEEARLDKWGSIFSGKGLWWIIAWWWGREVFCWWTEFVRGSGWGQRLQSCWGRSNRWVGSGAGNTFKYNSISVIFYNNIVDPRFILILIFVWLLIWSNSYSI